MSIWIYKEVIENLKEDCEAFLNNTIDVQTVQNKIYQAEIQIVALEEKWLRNLLFQLENDIEFAIFTIDSSELDKYIKEKIVFLLEKINNYENTWNKNRHIREKTNLDIEAVKKEILKDFQQQNDKSQLKYNIKIDNYNLEYRVHRLIDETYNIGTIIVK